MLLWNIITVKSDWRPLFLRCCPKSASYEVLFALRYFVNTGPWILTKQPFEDDQKLFSWNLLYSYRIKYAWFIKLRVGWGHRFHYIYWNWWAFQYALPQLPIRKYVNRAKKNELKAYRATEDILFLKHFPWVWFETEWNTDKCISSILPFNSASECLY